MRPKSICEVLPPGDSDRVFTSVVRPFANYGGKLDCGFRSQRHELIFKSGNPFTPTSDLSLDRSVNLESSSRRFHFANPFASENQLNNSGTYSSNPFASSESDTYNNPADLFTHRRKFSKPVKNPADYDGTQ